MGFQDIIENLVSTNLKASITCTVLFTRRHFITPTENTCFKLILNVFFNFIFLSIESFNVGRYSIV